MGTDTVDLHQYAPLESPYHIRLIALEPAQDRHSPLRFSFRQHNPNHPWKESYEALSYTWGPPVLVHPLFCSTDESVIMITTNLNEALRKLRNCCSPRWLWVDAVSINQSNEHEKATQIPFMTTIFRRADKVLAWLGPEGQLCEPAVHLLKAFSQQPINGARDMTDDDSVTNGFISHITNLLSVPWFRRMWIIQEVVFNLDTVLICGAAEISWARFNVALHRFAKTKAGSRLSAETVTRVRSINKIYSLWQRFSFFEQDTTGSDDAMDENGIMNLMTNFVSYGCSDERDRILALFSMANDINHPGKPVEHLPKTHIKMDIDLSLGLQEFYWSFEKAALANCTTQVLRCALARKHHSVADDWPSHLPDWRLPPVETEPACDFKDNAFDLEKIHEYSISIRADKALHLLVNNKTEFFTITDKLSDYEIDESLGWEQSFFRAAGRFTKAAGFNKSFARALFRAFPSLLGYRESEYEAAGWIQFSLMNWLEGGLLRYIVSEHRMNNRTLPISPKGEGESVPWEDDISRRDEIVGTFEYDITSHDQKEIEQRIFNVMKHRCLFHVSKPGQCSRILGIGNSHLREGDRVAVVTDTPLLSFDDWYNKLLPAMIIRPTENGCYRLISHASIWLFHSELEDSLCQCTYAARWDEKLEERITELRIKPVSFTLV